MSIALRPKIGLDNIRIVNKFLLPHDIIYCLRGIIYRGWFIRNDDAGGGMFRLLKGRVHREHYIINIRERDVVWCLQIVSPYALEHRMRDLYLPKIDQYWSTVHRLRVRPKKK